MGQVQNRAGLRAREWSLTVSALPQHPCSLNHRSSHPLARADQTSRWPARRFWQKRGQVVKVWLAPILVPALHSNPFVTLFQPLFRGRSHFGADFVPWRQTSRGPPWARAGKIFLVGFRAGEGLEPPFMLFFNGDYLNLFSQSQACFAEAQQLLAQGHRAPKCEKSARVGSGVVTCL